MKRINTTVSNRPGPLSGLGPAAKWLLSAGIAERWDDAPSQLELIEEADFIIEQGLAPVAVRALRDQPEHHDQTYSRLFHQVTMEIEMRSLAAAAASSHLLSELTRRGIPVTIFKGPAVARLHPNGWPRPYSDIDVMVSPQNFRSAIEVARTFGFISPESGLPQRRWFDLMCREGVNLHGGLGGNLDFHHHLAPWALGSHLSANQLLRRSKVGVICGATVNFAAPEDLLVISALHIVNDLWKGKLGLMSWRDIMIITKQIGETRASQVFDEAHLGWFFDVVVEEITSVLPQVGITAVSAGSALPFGPRMRLAMLGWTSDSIASRHRLAWTFRLPLPNAAAFLAGVAFPSREYISTRQGTYQDYWKRSLRETKQTLHGSDFRTTPVEKTPFYRTIGMTPK